MFGLRFVALQTVALVGGLALLTVPARIHAQEPAAAPAPVANASCLSDWACGSTRPPLGFYVDTVSDDGRYVTLEDGTIWEVQSDHRAATAAWGRDDFVEIRRIWAPTGDYEWLLTKVETGEWRAAARLAGRVRR